MIDILDDSTFWVAISFVIFVILTFNPVKKLVDSSLKNKIQQLKKDIDDAKNLMKEAKILHEKQLKSNQITQKRIDDMQKQLSTERQQIKQNFAEEILVSKNRKQKNFDIISKQLEMKISSEIKQTLLNKAIKYTEQRIRKNLSNKHNELLIQKSLEEISKHNFK